MEKGERHEGETMSQWIMILQDEEDLSFPSAREKAAKILGEIGPAAKAAVPALTKALKDKRWPQRFIRRDAARALGQIGPEAKACVSSLYEALEDKWVYVRIWAHYALAKITGNFHKHVLALIELLQDEAARLEAACALGELGPNAIAALPALEKALWEEEGWGPATIGAAKERIMSGKGKLREFAIPILTEALNDKNWAVRSAAAVALERFGPRAKSAVPALIDAIGDPVREVYCAVTTALVTIDTKVAVPIISQMLRNDIAEALVKCGKSAIPVFIEALKDEYDRVRARAAISLGEIGLGAKTAIPALRKALGDQDLWVREKASEALEKILEESDSQDDENW